MRVCWLWEKRGLQVFCIEGTALPCLELVWLTYLSETVVHVIDLGSCFRLKCSRQ